MKKDWFLQIMFINNFAKVHHKGISPLFPYESNAVTSSNSKKMQFEMNSNCIFYTFWTSSQLNISQLNKNAYYAIFSKDTLCQCPHQFLNPSSLQLSFPLLPVNKIKQKLEDFNKVDVYINMNPFITMIIVSYL